MRVGSYRLRMHLVRWRGFNHFMDVYQFGDVHFVWLGFVRIEVFVDRIRTIDGKHVTPDQLRRWSDL